MKYILAILPLLIATTSEAQKMNEYTISVNIDATQESVWQIITDFNNYPEWNSVLSMQNNDELVIGKKFDVTIYQPTGKKSKFKATTLAKTPPNSFQARQRILGKWFMEAIHYFTITDNPQGGVTFTQHWEFKGMVAKLFRKSIYKELEVFKTMNEELKAIVESKKQQ